MFQGRSFVVFGFELEECEGRIFKLTDIKLALSKFPVVAEIDVSDCQVVLVEEESEGQTKLEDVTNSFKDPFISGAAVRKDEQKDVENDGRKSEQLELMELLNAKRGHRFLRSRKKACIYRRLALKDY